MSAVCQVTFLSTPCAELHGIELGQPEDLVCPPPQTHLGTASSRVPASPSTGSGQSFRRITEALQPRGLPRSYSIVFQRKKLAHFCMEAQTWWDQGSRSSDQSRPEFRGNFIHWFYWRQSQSLYSPSHHTVEVL